MTKRSNKTRAIETATSTPATPNTTERAETLHGLAVVAMQAAAHSADASLAAKEGREGAAIVALRMFQTGATLAELETAFELAASEARNGMIEGVVLKQAKRKGKDGATKYLVPGPFMNAKSTVTRAAEFGISRETESFTKLKELVADELARRAALTATEQQAAFAELVAIAEQIADTCKEKENAELPVAALSEMQNILRAAVRALGQVIEGAATVEATVSAQAAEALAEAA